MSNEQTGAPRSVIGKAGPARDYPGDIAAAARDLAVSLADAKAAGYAIAMPFQADDLGRIAVSETRKVQQ